HDEFYIEPDKFLRIGFEELRLALCVTSFDDQVLALDPAKLARGGPYPPKECRICRRARPQETYVANAFRGFRLRADGPREKARAAAERPTQTAARQCRSRRAGSCAGSWACRADRRSGPGRRDTRSCGLSIVQRESTPSSLDWSPSGRPLRTAAEPASSDVPAR